MNKLISQIEKEVENIFAQSGGCHDFDHTQRVTKIAMKLAHNEKARLDIVTFAALLHDIGRPEQDASCGKICHAKIGAKKAEQILEKYGIGHDDILLIKHCIETHRYRKNNPPQTLEAKILFDADKLDAIGAIGIGRAFVFSGECKARVHSNEIRPDEKNAYTKNDTAYNEYMVKLRHIKDQLKTKSGKKIANHRHDFMVSFFEELCREADGKV